MAIIRQMWNDFGIECIMSDVFVAFISLSRLILCLRLANERRRYKVTPSLIGWAQT